MGIRRHATCRQRFLAVKGRQCDLAIMETDIRYDCAGVDWGLVSETLKRVGMARFKHPEKMREKGFTD